MDQQVASINLPVAVIHSLINKGYIYVKNVNIKDPQVSKIIDEQSWLRATEVPVIKTALDVYEEECDLRNILTFIKQLDRVLGGGIGISQITELYGDAGSGKTQMCLLFCINVQMPTWCGGVEGEAIYISTNYNFSKERFKDYAYYSINKYNSLKKKHGRHENDHFNIDNVMKRVHYFKCTDHMQLLTLPTYLKSWLTAHKRIRLIVIDNITLPVKEIEDKDRNKLLYRFLSDLQILSVMHKFAIVLTNDLTIRCGKSGRIFYAPSLGDNYSQRINTRIELKKVNMDMFSAEVVASSSVDSECVTFKLNC